MRRACAAALVWFAAARLFAAPHEALIGDGAAWFVPEDFDAAKCPSFSFAAPPREQGPLPPGWKLRPKIEPGRATLDVPAQASLYGTGEVTGPLLRNGRTIALWNTDNYRYGKDGGRRLYQSHPWVMGVRPDGSAFGVLFDTTFKAELTTADDRIVFSAPGAPPFRVALIDRDSPQAVVRALAELTGRMPMPPRWALGFHQCRYSYYPDSKVREIAGEFRRRQIPCDVIWLDIHYMDGFRIFTFDPQRFPDPAATNGFLHDNGFHSVWMIDPGVKVDPGYAVYDSGKRADVFVKAAAGGADFEGKVWPGVCAFPDFTRPETRAWWSSQYRNFLAKGVDGVWNDMNEPSVFETPDGTMAEDAWHRGGGGLPPGPHRLYHNAYGLLMTQATREGLLHVHPGRRPFVLTRANFIGGQRCAATWTGDNAAPFEFLQTAVPMSLNLSLSGQPFSGPDIGGYSGACTPELFGKWIATGAFFPFCRAHTAVDNPPREPWAFGEEIERVSRTALQRRYRLMPYLYTLAERAAREGDPIMQPVFFADPKDPELRAEQGAFLFGPDLLVTPKWASSPHLPKGIWRSMPLLDGDAEKDGYQAEVRIRGGAIVPLGGVVERADDSPKSPLTLRVCLDASGKAEGALYDDGGDGYNHDALIVPSRFIAEQKDGVVTVRLREVGGGVPHEAIVELVTDSGIKFAKGDPARGIEVR